jgi:histidinol-phosphatase (PHP family)
MIDATVDHHVHTRLCHHARGEMEDYVRSAVSKGLRKLVFLEHLEVGISYFESTWLAEEDFDYYHTEGTRLQEKYRDIIQIGLGVEVGYNPRMVGETLQQLARYNWDMIGISYHFLKTGDTHLNMVSRKKENLEQFSQFGVDEAVTRYYKGLREAVDKLPGNMLCHIDAVLRHHPRVNFTEEHATLIDTVLDAVARKKMTLEVNTSGYRTRDMPFPSPPILRQAVKRNIPLAAGSDAHRPEDVGRDFDRLDELMEEIGERLKVKG